MDKRVRTSVGLGGVPVIVGGIVLATGGWWWIAGALWIVGVPVLVWGLWPLMKDEEAGDQQRGSIHLENVRDAKVSGNVRYGKFDNPFLSADQVDELQMDDNIDINPEEDAGDDEDE